MQIGWGQLIVIILVLFFLFGNLPKLMKETSYALQELLNPKNNNKKDEETNQKEGKNSVKKEKD
jgi:Sec-independent protein translocase protein TatA